MAYLVRSPRPETRAAIRIEHGKCLVTRQEITKSGELGTPGWYWQQESRRAPYYRIRSQYDVSLEDAEQLANIRANGRCEICGEVNKKLNIDHDHETGQVRGILCVPCNIMVGYLESEYAEGARTYLRRKDAAH